MKSLFKITPFILVLIVLSSCQGDIDSGNYSNYASSDGIYGGQEGISGEKYAEVAENPFVKVSEQPVSTFSIDADGGSYSNTRRFLNQGENPPPASVRVEEYINYFTFDYGDPQGENTLSLNSGLATCPWNMSHHIMRFGIKGKSIAYSEIPATNYVFLIDVSGSMNSDDKLGILKSGFKTMVDNLRQQDRVAIVTYAGSAAVLLQSTSGDEKQKIKTAIDKLGAKGSTAGAEGILTAYRIASDNFIQDGNNRVIIGSDGDFNVGPSSTDELIELIENKRESGIYLTVLGVGTGNLNDHMMEQIANKGNGNYEYIDNVSQLNKVFVHERAKFYTVAKDSKIQITFNPMRVDSFRLIGYENRSLNDEDFENDTVDAGEIGATQTITALYEVALSASSGVGDYATFDVRYKKPGSEQSLLLSHELDMAPDMYQNSSENMRFAMAVTCFGLLTKESAYKKDASKQLVISLGEGALLYDPNDYRKEFIQLVKKWKE